MKLRLEVAAQSADPFPLEFEGSAASLGRDPGCELPLGPAGSDVVSWRHARIELTPRGAYLSDLGSSNGTFVNDRRVTGRLPLRPGAYIRLGHNGPTLHVVGLDLSAPAAASKPPAAPRPVAVPSPPSPRPPAPVRASSATRRMLISMRQGQRKLLVGAAIAGGCLLVALAAVFWVEGDRIARAFGKIDKVDVEARRQEDEIRRQDEDNKRRDGEIEEARQRLKTIEDLDGDLIARMTKAEGEVVDLTAAEAKTRRQEAEGLARLRTDLEDRLHKVEVAAAGGSRTAPPSGPGSSRSGPPSAASLEALDWSQPMPAYVSYQAIGRQYINPVELLSAVPPHLLVRFANDDRRAGPRRWAYNTINWIQTKDNLYVYNAATNGFDRVLTHYVYDPNQCVFNVQHPQDDQASRWVTRCNCRAFTKGGLPYPGLAVMDDSGRFVLSLPINGLTTIAAEDIPSFLTPGQNHRFDAVRRRYVVNQATVEENQQFRENATFWAYTLAEAYHIATR